jgi:hypothetical protein
MAEIIRETFIALHSSDILAKLDEEVCGSQIISSIILTFLL